jgi:predicted acylesterase/phospholipase RssA
MRKILSIDAGGVRGIIPATILAEVEARTGQPVCSLFDFLAGTSSGGMLVLALNCPATSGCARPLRSAKEVASLFHEWGNRAFGDKLSKKVQTIAEITSENGIEDMFREYFGDALLSDSIKPTIVTAFDLTTAQPFFLNSAKAVRNVGDDFLMWQAARATTAVPPYFSPLRLSISHMPFRRAREACLVDGSLFASNPAMCALAEARSLFPGEDDFLLISLGCGEARHAFLPVALRQNRRRIFDYSSTAQSACVEYQMRAFLPRQRYIRIQAELEPGFDRIDDASEKNLLALQRKARETIAGHQDVLDQLVDLLAPESDMALA